MTSADRTFAALMVSPLGSYGDFRACGPDKSRVHDHCKARHGIRLRAGLLVAPARTARDRLNSSMATAGGGSAAAGSARRRTSSAVSSEAPAPSASTHQAPALGPALTTPARAMSPKRSAAPAPPAWPGGGRPPPAAPREH